jgi:stalled ribosome alternative rescue factor ArfA
MIKNRKRTSEEIRYWQELRRSNAASKHKNKAKYTRKAKHKGREYV